VEVDSGIELLHQVFTVVILEGHEFDEVMLLTHGYHFRVVPAQELHIKVLPRHHWILKVAIDVMSNV
jgi:hypothetical protein